MVKVYKDGNAFLIKNESFLNVNKFSSAFFFYDAPLLKEINKDNYAIKLEEDNNKILALKVEPFNLLIYGDESLTEKLMDYIIKNDYNVNNTLTNEDIGKRFVDFMKNNQNVEYIEALAMNFMKCEKKYAETNKLVEVPTEDDIDEIMGCLNSFIKDCGLEDKVNKEKQLKTIEKFRIIRKDNKIVAMAKYSDYTDGYMSISDVYTKDEYRGNGFAKMCVIACMNVIFEKGKMACLNLDKNNKVTSHLYPSLGFEKVFSQGEYRRK